MTLAHRSSARSCGGACRPGAGCLASEIGTVPNPATSFKRSTLSRTTPTALRITGPDAPWLPPALGALLLVARIAFPRFSMISVIFCSDPCLDAALRLHEASEQLAAHVTSAAKGDGKLKLGRIPRRGSRCCADAAGNGTARFLFHSL